MIKNFICDTLLSDILLHVERCEKCRNSFIELLEIPAMKFIFAGEEKNKLLTKLKGIQHENHT
jgi:hypothetical protein